MMPKKRSDPAQQGDENQTGKLQGRFGFNFRLFRSHLGLTQRDVAKAAGIAQKDISLIERGRVNVTIGTMERLAKVVDHDVSQLLTETPDPTPKK